MASREFAYVYTIDFDTVSVADVPPYTNLTVTGASDLTAGSASTTSPASLDNLTFDYEADNGFVASGGGASHWFSDAFLVLAEGVPAETFVDDVTRRRFDNWADYEALYGDTGATIAAPRVKPARQLPRALRERLAGAGAAKAAA